MNKNFKKIVIALFTVFILVNFALNIKLLFKAVKVSVEEKANFTQVVSNIKEEYISGFNAKNFYVNLNGLFARATGKIVHNDTARLNNGMLNHGKFQKVDTVPHATAIAEFDSFLKQKDIKFIYVQAPYKLDAEKQLLPIGIENYAIETMDDMVHNLKENKVDVLDLRPYLSQDIEMVDKYFYPTDHHWNVRAAFVAFQKICEKLQNMFPDEEIISEYLNEDAWETESYEDKFLGSFGRRTGVFYGGVDNLDIMLPKFDTEMSLYINKYNNFRSGDFSECNIVYNYLTKKMDLLESDAYCTFIGGDYPLTESYTRNAKSNLKLLIIKDSFTRPVQAFMSTVFSEIDVIDPRHFKDCTIAEYVDMNEPDVVIMLSNLTAIGVKEYSEFGVLSANEWDNAVDSIVFEDVDITIEPKQSAYNFTVLADNMSEGSKYTLKLSDIDIIGKETKSASVSLYDPVNKQHLIRAAVDKYFVEDKGCWEWSFIAPKTNNGSLQLLLYAGEAGKTDNIGLKATDVSLKRTDKVRIDEKLSVVNKKIVKLYGKHDYAYTVIDQYLEKSTEYMLSIGEINIESGDCEKISISLYDKDAGVHIIRDSFDLKTNSNYKWKFTTPATGDNLQLLVYAGEFGNTAGNAVEFINMNLSGQREITETLAKGKNIVIKAEEDKNYKYSCLVDKADYAATYIVEIGNINVITGNSEKVTVSLYDKASGKHLDQKELDCTITGPHSVAFSTPKDAGTLQILLYAGVKGKTGGNELSFENINVYKF